jgi:hypothetical protein
MEVPHEESQPSSKDSNQTPLVKLGPTLPPAWALDPVTPLRLEIEQGPTLSKWVNDLDMPREHTQWRIIIPQSSLGKELLLVIFRRAHKI